MARFDRPCMTFYQSAIVTTALTVPFANYLTLNNTVTLKSGLEVTKVIETGAIQKLGCGFLFAIYTNYGRRPIFSHFGDIQRQKMA